MYRILFIDEEQETFDYFLDYVDNYSSKEKIEVVTLFPLESKEETIEEIFKINPDAVITDFMLNDIKTDIRHNVPYNGVELMESLLEVREDFPFFVLTSFDDVAVSESDDVNKIYTKNILHNNKEESKAKAKFLDRVLHQIIHYKSKLEDSQKELIELIELRNSGKATIADEEKLIKLDDFLERSIDKRSSIPENYKNLSNFDRLGKLIEKVDTLLKKVDEANDN